jgi:hypothetical protein
LPRPDSPSAAYISSHRSASNANTGSLRAHGACRITLRVQRIDEAIALLWNPPSCRRIRPTGWGLGPEGRSTPARQL